MKTFILLSSLLAVSSGIFTCDKCTEAIMILQTNSIGNLEIEIAGLIETFCPDAEDPEFCALMIPDFWRVLGAEIWTEAWSHLCDDIVETCSTTSNDIHPNCQECEARVRWSMTYLRDPMIGQHYVDKYTSPSNVFCGNMYSGEEEACRAAITSFVPPALYYLASDNYWVPNFCQESYGMECRHFEKC